MTWLTTKEAAKYLRVSERTLYLRLPEMPAELHTRFGKKRLFNRERLDEWLSNKA